MNTKTFIRVAFIVFPIFMVLGIIANIMMYNECKSDGYSTFACMSMSQKGQYIIVDHIDGQE